LRARVSFSRTARSTCPKGERERYEVVAFSAEATGVVPTEPGGSKIQLAQKPAFYLYAPLPGSKIPSIYCGHGQDCSASGAWQDRHDRAVSGSVRRISTSCPVTPGPMLAACRLVFQSAS
jgi:hypothetical protein